MTVNNAAFEMMRRIDQAMAREPADLVIKNVSLLNIVTGETAQSDIAITGNKIVGTYDTYQGKVEIDGTGLTAVPGFIDCHVHVESSLITPDEFDRCVLPHGTTTAVCDPHEMANVLGVPALKYFQRVSETTIMDLIVNLSSCVPASPLETSGAQIEAADLNAVRHHRNTIGLSEFMNIGGVLGKDPAVVDKLVAFSDGHIDGHLPGVTSYAMNAMLSCGICNCHESTTLAGGQEKLRKGVQVFIREGTVCKDAQTLNPLITARTSPFLGFCTDDRNPLEIAREGHIDHIIRTSIKLGADPADVYRAASWSAAQGFGLHKNTPKWERRGLIAPGYKADIVLLNDVNNCVIHSVIKNGQMVKPDLFDKRPKVEPIGYDSVKIREIVPQDFKLAANASEPVQDVIGLIDKQIVTEHLRLPVKQDGGEFVSDTTADILKLAVIERHGKNGNIAVGFVQGFGFKSGAVASTVGHDSHNITVVGTNDKDMAVAVNALRANQGGYVIVNDGKILASLSLPIAGLMSDKSFEAVRDELPPLRAASKEIGSKLGDPTMMLAFLPLCVIPTLRLTDFGMTRFSPPGDEGPVLLRDQRGIRRNALPVLAA